MKKDGYGALCLTAIGLIAFEVVAKLHEQGVLTDEEFEQKKQMILQKI